MQTKLNGESIIQQLRADYGESIVIEEKPLQEALDAEALRYQGMGIKALSVVGGFLASSFFLGFVFLITSNLPVVMLILGLVTMSISIVLSLDSKTVALDTVSISAYLSACLMIGIAMHEFTKNDNLISIVLLLIALIVPLMTKGYMLNFLSVLMIQGCLFAFLNINGGKELAHVFMLLPATGFAWLSLSEPILLTRSVATNVRFNAWRTGLLFSLLAAIAYSASIPIGNSASNVSWLHVLALPIWGSLLVLLMSFHTGHRTGLIAGILVLIYSVGQYYYNLHLTLLTKSYVMMGTGVLFLLVWFVFKKKLKQVHEQD